MYFTLIMQLIIILMVLNGITEDLLFHDQELEFGLVNERTVKILKSNN